MVSKGASMGLMAVLALLLVFSGGKAAGEPSVDAKLVIAKADRKVDLTSQFVKDTASLKLENTGKQTVNEVLIAVPASGADRLAHISAKQGKGRNSVELEVIPVFGVAGIPSNVTVLSAALKRPIGAGGTGSLEVLTIHTRVLQPKPEELGQSEPQLVLYHGSAYLLTPYAVRTQTTKIKVPSINVKSFSKSPEPAKKADLEVSYGPYADVATLSTADISVHFENTRPFVIVEELIREIEVSHWGNIYVVEQYKLLHGGARFKGGFSRLDFQSKPGSSGTAAIKELQARLPPRAHSAYYRDEIGNISTSHFFGDRRKTNFDIEPRYPLMGGWRTEFTLGYSLPLEDFLFKTKEGFRVLNITFGCPVVDAVVDHLTVKVVLPEGSSVKDVNVPFAVQQSSEVKKTYLDTVGRPVVVLEKSNAVPEHNVNFEVTYGFSPLVMLAKPLLLVAVFGLFFLTCMAYLRLDFTISKSSAGYQQKLQAERVLDAKLRLQKVLSERLSVANRLEASLKELSRTGDVAAAKSAKKTADASLKESSKTVKAALEDLEAIRNQLAIAKGTAVASKEKEKQALLAQLHTTTVDAFEKNANSSDIDQRTAPVAQKLAALGQEVNSLLLALEG